MSRLSRSLKVIGIDTDWSATYDFLSVIRSNHRPISYRFRDKQQFLSKFANFFPPLVFNAHTDGVPLEFCNAEKLQSFPYRMVERVWRYMHSFPECDGQTDGQICDNNIALCLHRHADTRYLMLKARWAKTSFLKLFSKSLINKNLILFWNSPNSNSSFVNGGNR